MEKQKDTPCPWWFCFVFDNFIREWLQNPVKIMTPLVKPGFKVLDIGPGRGYCAFPLASLVQPGGLVVALDIQKKMLAILTQRAERKGCSNVTAHLYDGKNFGIEQRFDLWSMTHFLPLVPSAPVPRALNSSSS
jgi:ubiquinone/menaquinone biosynthesis C-methylase UbiE